MIVTDWPPENLPGLLAVDGSRVDGWTFYTRDGDVLQLGGLVSESGEATA